MRSTFTIPELVEQFKARFKYAENINWDRQLETDEETGFIRLNLFTNEYVYHIRAHTNGYLGCVMSCRKPRPCEDWTRGSDLPDGDNNAETWGHILCAIIDHEAVRAEDKQPPSVGIEEMEVVATA